jgi:hypothetical protein
LADARGSDFLDEVKGSIGHWYAERHASDRDRLGPDATVEIAVTTMGNTLNRSPRMTSVSPFYLI